MRICLPDAAPRGARIQRRFRSAAAAAMALGMVVTLGAYTAEDPAVTSP